MKSKHILQLALVALLAFNVPFLMACGSATTFDRIGNGAKQIIAGVRSEINSLKIAGAFDKDPSKAERILRAINSADITATALSDFLKTLPGVTASNKPDVIRKLAEFTAIVRGLLQNPDITGLAGNNILIKVLTYGDLSLQVFATTLENINPKPGTQSFALGGGTPEEVRPLKSIKVVPPKPDKDIEKYFKG